VYIMYVGRDEDGSETYEMVEDEAVQEAVFTKFLQIMEDGEDAGDE